jgi:hypothetical protein
MDEFAERLEATAAAHEKEVQHDCTGSMLSHDNSDTNHSPCFVSVPSAHRLQFCVLSYLSLLSLLSISLFSFFSLLSFPLNRRLSFSLPRFLSTPTPHPGPHHSARRSIGRAGGRSARRERGAFARARNRAATVVRRRCATAAVGSGIVLSLSHRHIVKIICPIMYQQTRAIGVLFLFFTH